MSKKVAFQNNAKIIFPYLLILIVSILILLKPLGSGDELWNYNFARNILWGNVPYKDFSIVQTPLSCYVSALFLWIFGDGLLTFKILAYVIFVSIALLLFDLSKKLTKNTIVALCGTAVAMSAHFMFIIYNYNYLTTLVLLLVFELELSGNNRLRNNLLIGLLVGATMLIKQNTGLLIWVANIIICFRRGKRNPEFRNTYIYRIMLSIIPVAGYGIYLLCAGAFRDFMEYAVLGISTFTHRYTLIDLFNDAWIFSVYFVLIIVAYLLIGVRICRERVTEFQFAALSFSVAWVSIIYPLADLSHILLILIPLTPVFFSFYSFANIKRKRLLIGMVELIFAFQVMILTVLVLKSDFHVSKIHNYQGVLMDERTEKIINEVDDYIVQKEKEGYKVRIADMSSATYMIPLDRYEKNWDMLLVGNIGSNNIQDLLKSDRPTLYLVLKNEELDGLQHHCELIDYIKNNYSCIDEVENFYVYEGK